MRARLKFALLFLAGMMLATAAYGEAGTQLVVQSGAYLSYGGITTTWATGTYGSCTVTLYASDCLGGGSGTGSQQSLFAAFMFAAILIGFMLIAVVVAMKRRR